MTLDPTSFHWRAWPETTKTRKEMHLQTRTLKVSVLFPDHDKRTESPEHREVRQKLIAEEKRPCFICGRNVDDLTAQFQAKGLSAGEAAKEAEEYLEVHHLWAEYAEYDDIDVSRVQADHPLFAAYNAEGTYTDKDSLAGSLILCVAHHRGAASRLYPDSKRATEEGIHESDFPTWLMQKYIKDADLDKYIPGIVVIRKGISDESGYLTPTPNPPVRKPSRKLKKSN